MFIETPIGNRNQVSVEAALIASGLVSCYEDDRFTLWVERESRSPLPVGRREPQFFHISMARAGKLVGVRPRETGSIPSQPFDLCCEFQPDLLLEVGELPFEDRVKFHVPYHCVPIYTRRHAYGAFQF